MEGTILFAVFRVLFAILAILFAIFLVLFVAGTLPESYLQKSTVYLRFRAFNLRIIVFYLRK
jgi:hypothetical protein